MQKLRKAKTMGVAPQGLMQIATRSVNATSTFVMRTHSSDITRGSIEELDKLMVSLAGEIMLTSLDSREAIAQLKLPIKMGGAGIGYATRLRSACYVEKHLELLYHLYALRNCAIGQDPNSWLYASGAPTHGTCANSKHPNLL